MDCFDNDLIGSLQGMGKVQVNYSGFILITSLVIKGLG
ncbi:hypothetical protein Lepto7375DRAFT_3048 [Leptolyngbya sp. PCC 7375]|nr:hypothetical protein Lepto7375DRAFT_3048 [Leptolyngbya sp. PCC 7375]